MMKILMKTAYLFLGILAALNMGGCNSNDTTEVDNNNNIPQYTSAGWYMKTSVSATDPVTLKEYSHKTAGVFGELNDSSDTKDRHDIPGYGSAILQVVFVQTTWENDNGDYFSDYHSNSSDDERKVWTFQVKNEKNIHLENADLTIVLDGAYDIFSLEKDGRTIYKESLSHNNSKKEAIKLVDVDNQRVYTYEELQNGQLNMDGLHIRTFRWVLGDVEDRDYAPLNAIASKTLSLSKAVSKKLSAGFVFEEKPSVEEVFTPSTK